MSELINTMVICGEYADERILNMIIHDLGRKPTTQIYLVNRSTAPEAYSRRTVKQNGERGSYLSEEVAHLLKGTKGFASRVAIVFDLKFGSPSQPAPDHSMYGEWLLVPAVPNVEAWVLSDPVTYSNYHTNDSTGQHKSFEAYIADVGLHFFNQKQKIRLSTKRISQEYSVFRAAMLSPSLRWFIKATDPSPATAGSNIAFDLNKALLSNLVQEYYPLSHVLYKALDGSTYTGLQMAEEIRVGSEIGRKYTSDLLRVCRDLLARQASNLQAKSE